MVGVSAFFAGEGREAYEMKKAVQIGRRSREKTPDKMFRGLEPIARKHKSRVSVVTETYVSQGRRNRSGLIFFWTRFQL